MKISELTGMALDWAVAKCEGRGFELPESFIDYHDNGDCKYSTNWAQGGPIIERECICIRGEYSVGYLAYFRHSSGTEGVSAIGSTNLIAAMRCYVASKLGADVEIPKELA